MKTQVKSITEKEGNKPWKFVLSHDGEIYSTFNPDVRSGLTVDMWIEATIEVEKKGQYTNRYLSEWKAIETPKVGEAPPDMSEAKDRAIAMESAYKAAAEVLKALSGSHPDKVTAASLQSIAHMVYRDIQEARAGESFEPARQGEAKEPKEAAKTPESAGAKRHGVDMPY